MVDGTRRGSNRSRGRRQSTGGSLVGSTLCEWEVRVSPNQSAELESVVIGVEGGRLVGQLAVWRGAASILVVTTRDEAKSRAVPALCDASKGGRWEVQVTWAGRAPSSQLPAPSFPAPSQAAGGPCWEEAGVNGGTGMMSL